MGLGDMTVTYTADVGNLVSGSDLAKSAISSVADSATSSGSGILGAFQNIGSGFTSLFSTIGQVNMGLQAVSQAAQWVGDTLLGPAETAETTSLAFATLLERVLQIAGVAC